MLDNLVAYVGVLVSAAVAIGLAWRGRSRLEPSEEDISKGPQKISALATAISLPVILAQRSSPTAAASFTAWAIWLGVICIVAFLFYSLLVGGLTYNQRLDKTRVKRVIGGFWLSREAKKVLKKRKDLSVQELFAGSAYEKDKVWPRTATALARTTFLLLYLTVTVTGSLAVACAAMLYSLNPK